MPKLYEYLGLIILFYSNEHEPIHVHGKYQGTESKAELIIKDGKITEIRYVAVKGRKPLSGNALNNFKAVVESHAEEIIQKWIDYFVLHKSIQSYRLVDRGYL